MKLLAITMALFLSGPTWLGNFNKATIEATNEHKLILINFSGSDWCGPCIRLTKEIFESQAFEDYASKNLVLVRADFPRQKKNQLPEEQQKQNEKLADKYNSNGTFPETLLVDENGKILKEWDGFPNESPEEFVSEINTIAHAPH
ncbi:MAG TPA: thioredoxin family protein [Hanamia sp.]|nr:thioredoxin family protein [Hanamia sp.]